MTASPRHGAGRRPHLGAGAICSRGPICATAFCALLACSGCGSRDPVASRRDASLEDDAMVAPEVDANVPPRPDAAGADAGLGVNVVDVPDTPCVPKGGSSVVLYPPTDAGTAAFDLLRTVGARRVAQGSSGEGFVTFDPDGKNASAAPTQLPIFDNKVASTGTSIILAGTTVDPKSVVFGRYDASGAPMGGQGKLADEPTIGLAVGGGGGLALVTWASASALRARGIDAQGPVGTAPFDFAYTNLTHDLTASIADDGNGRFAVAFSGDDSAITFQTVFGRGTTSARVGDPFALFTGHRPRRVVQLVKTPTGYALLFSAGGNGAFGALVLLDAGGQVFGAAHKLAGTRQGLGVAAHGTELGVLAQRALPSRALEFRPFDATGAPLGPWVCIDGQNSDASSDTAAIDADGTGYAILYRRPDGSEVFARVDHLGTGNP